LRLQVDHELIAADRLAQVTGERLARALGAAQRGGVMDGAPAPARLGLVERGVGAQDHVFAGDRPFRARSAGPDGGPDADRLVLPGERAFERAQHLSGAGIECRRALWQGADKQEFVAAGAAGKVARPGHPRQHGGDVAQRAIARAVAVRVVDFLELVDVDHQHAEPPAGDLAAQLRCIEMLGQPLAIGEPGQVVVMGGVAQIDLHLPQGQFGIDLVGHVAAGDDDLAVAPVGAEIDHRECLLVPEGGAVAADMTVEPVTAEERAVRVVAKAGDPVG
jgi:hypothetical protein